MQSSWQLLYYVVTRIHICPVFPDIVILEMKGILEAPLFHSLRRQKWEQKGENGSIVFACLFVQDAANFSIKKLKVIFSGQYVHWARMPKTDVTLHSCSLAFRNTVCFSPLCLLDYTKIASIQNHKFQG